MIEKNKKKTSLTVTYFRNEIRNRCFSRTKHDYNFRHVVVASSRSRNWVFRQKYVCTLLHSFGVTQIESSNTQKVADQYNTCLLTRRAGFMCQIRGRALHKSTNNKDDSENRLVSHTTTFYQNTNTHLLRNPFYDGSTASSTASSTHSTSSFSIPSILMFPLGHPVSAYLFFLVYPSLLSFLLF